MWNYFICTARYQDQSNIYEIFARSLKLIEFFFFFKLSNFWMKNVKFYNNFELKI